jgi:acyl CoA:acetate/3-ketoacid CoA transferase
LLSAAAVLALLNLDRTGDENHVVNASALAASTAADIGFIGLNVISGVATNPILVGTHHAGPQFVKNLESRLVTLQSESCCWNWTADIPGVWLATK